MKKEIIKTGDKFGRLVAVKFSHKNKNSCKFWLFLCSCGNEKIINVSRVKTGETKSCGCLKNEKIKKLNLKHGMCHTRIYRIWAAMKRRCLNKNCQNYRYYGKRGIKVCDEWLGFENFYKDMGDDPKNKTLDRIDNNDNYYLKNCRWATLKEQCNNRRSNLINKFNN